MDPSQAARHSAPLRPALRLTRPARRWTWASPLGDEAPAERFGRAAGFRLTEAAGQRCWNQRIVSVLDKISKKTQPLVRLGRKPGYITVDNGSEFISKALDQWAHWHRVQLDFIRHGKPTENAHIESFNGRFRQECLNAHWFQSLDEARQVIEMWRREYNADRPHSALNGQAPEEFLRGLTTTGPGEKAGNLTL